MDIKELRSLLKLLRTNGITHYKSNDLELQFSPEALLLPKEEQLEETSSTWDRFPDTILTPEQLMYYSSGGVPGEEGNS